MDIKVIEKCRKLCERNKRKIVRKAEETKMEKCKE